MPSSDVRIKEEYGEAQSPFTRRTPSDCGDLQSEGEGSGPDSHHELDLLHEHTPVAYLTSIPIAQQPRNAVKDEGCDLHLPFSSSIPPLASVSASPPHLGNRNGIIAVTLSAAGMRPLLVEVDRYAPPSPSLSNYSPRVNIYIKLSLSSLYDVSSPPALHGFTGTVAFAAPWTSVAQCMTRVVAGGVCESVEYGYLEPTTPLSPVSMTPVTVPLPESELSRCRWGNRGE
jgi:hypothetical protein